jgi:hypothetical protein
MCTHSTESSEPTLPPIYSNVRQLITHRPILILLVVAYALMQTHCSTVVCTELTILYQ